MVRFMFSVLVLIGGVAAFTPGMTPLALKSTSTARATNNAVMSERSGMFYKCSRTFCKPTSPLMSA